jgi:hypothetical protein
VNGLGALRAALRADGGTLAEVLVGGDQLPSASGPAQVAASGPRARGHEGEYELLMEMIFEGSLLHYGAARVVHTDDPDLALLLGDQLYALGLARLAALGDVEAVSVLAEVIARLSEAQAEGNPERAQQIWEDGARAIGWGVRSVTEGS